MNTERIEIEFELGMTVEEAWKCLKKASEEAGMQTFGSFNNRELTSNMTLDEAYIAVSNKTKLEVDQDEQNYIDMLKRKEEKHKATILTLEKQWCKKARGIIREDKLDFWDEIVPYRLNDLYHGMELEHTLNLVQMLDIDNCELEEAKQEFYNQGHSGMSASLMFSMMKEFCLRGIEFIEYVEKMR